MSYQVMLGQAGNRQIISWKERNSRGIWTSHYASLEEFFRLKASRNIEWYRVNNGEKIFIEEIRGEENGRI